MNDEQKYIINTQGGPAITGGNFTNVEFVANKYVVESHKKKIPMAMGVEVEEVKAEEFCPHNEESTSTGAILLSCIETLMDEKDEKGKYLVSKANHWMAIFRIIVDKNLGASNTDYLGFCNMINGLKPEGFRVKLKYDSLKAISKSNYTKPFEKWQYDPAYNETRNPYDKMVEVATHFKAILEKNDL